MASESIKMLLAGAGFIGKVHLEEAKPLDSVKYVGVADINEEAAKSVADEYGLKPFKDLDEAIKELKPDAVDICVPTPYHLPLVKVCANHKTNILCEKPVALNLKDAEEIKNVVSQAGVRIMFAHVIRFWPEYRYARKVAEGKTYGEILSLDCRRLSPPPDWNSWMMKPETGGGAAIDLQIHDLDFAFQLLGKPKAIQATGRKEQGAYNSVANHLIYPSGIPVYIQASYLMPPSYPFRMYFQIELEKATLEMDFWRPKGERLKIFPLEGKEIIPNIKQDDPYGAEIDYFCRKLKTGQPLALVPLEESITALKLCLASQESCGSGKPVSL